jgi:hypothetical protein
MDCHGVGYEVQVPMSTFYNLPEIGAKVTLADPLCGAGGRTNFVRFCQRGRA